MRLWTNRTITLMNETDPKGFLQATITNIFTYLFKIIIISFLKCATPKYRYLLYDNLTLISASASCLTWADAQ